jgi:hypothetical protein
MLPAHLLIGVVEAGVTALAIGAVALMSAASLDGSAGYVGSTRGRPRLLITAFSAAFVMAGVALLAASPLPDALEASLEKLAPAAASLPIANG